MILIAGLGYIGEALADHLQASGQTVAGLTKSADSAAALAQSKPYPVHACNISNPREVRDLASELTGVKSVVHCASSGRGGADAYRAVYLEGARNLLDAFPSATLLFTSSTSVYAQADGSDVTEQAPTEPDRDTGKLLIETENLVLAKDGIVARLAGIYGPTRSVILKKFLAGTAIIEEDGDRLLNQAHRADIVSALALLLSSPGAAAQTYNVVDDEPLAQRVCYEFLAQHFRKTLPPTGPRDPGRKRGWTHKRVSNAKLRSLGWSPAYPSFKEAVLNDPALVPSIESTD